MISNKMKDLVATSSIIRAMFEEGKRLSDIYGEENVYDYSLGNPNVAPPESIKIEIKKILDQTAPKLLHGYMNNSGYEDVRTKIAQFLNKKYNVNITYSNIVMTCGAAGGLNILFKTLLNPEEEVIVFSPFFGEYRNYVNNYNGKLVVVPTNIDTFEPDMLLLKGKINSKTKAVIINSPNNPTGVVYSEKVIQDLTKVLNEKEKELGISIYLISDEPYREIVYDNVPVPYILNYYKNSFIGYSYSKSLSLPGERIGYVVANTNMDGFNDIMTSLNVANRILGFVNAPSLFQRVVANCLDAEVDVSIYKKNRDVLYNHLVKIGFKCVKPQGAFYLFIRTPIADDKKFCEDAKQFNLLLVGGSAFGCPGHARLSYCISLERIQNSLPAFDKLSKLYNIK
ncbi:MAG: pyridoxal phosphate-dependent aminotransferase [Clostridium sp.]|uniref:pyridoxal phosphate-dependent aminotransferase n=1 Tax=Clostridium sp. TaxID=1506 RepID=UPI003D6C942E